MKISLYFDEDIQTKGLIQALRSHGIDVVVAWQFGMRQREDEEQLAFAVSQGRVLFGCNVRDYFRIHSNWLAQGRSHCGIVLPKQQAYSIGDELKRVLRLIEMKSAEEMLNQIEFLSDWGR